MAKEKIRTKSQKIGEIGESIFREWAVRNSMSATKTENDFGIDFYCQVFRGDGGREMATGDMLSVQVKATSPSGKKRKIDIKRRDVESVVSVASPYCLIGVDIDTRDVRFRLVDETFISELHKFLASGRMRLAIDFQDLDSDHFAQKLEVALKHPTQKKNLWHKARLGIKEIDKYGDIYYQDVNGNAELTVKLPWFTSVFSAVNKEEIVARKYFATGQLPPLIIDNIHPKIKAATRLVDGNTFVFGMIERDVNLTVRDVDSVKHSVRVKEKRYGDEIAFVTQSGLVLSLSGRREAGGGKFVHVMKSYIAEVNCKSPFSDELELQFLLALREDSEILLGDISGGGIPVNSWENLQYLSCDLEAVDSVFGYLDMERTDVSLSHVTNEPFILTIELIDAFVRGDGIVSALPGFTFEQREGLGKWVSCGYRIPIVCNLMGDGVVVWVVGQGLMHLVDNTIIRPPDLVQFANGFRHLVKARNHRF